MLTSHSTTHIKYYLWTMTIAMIFGMGCQTAKRETKTVRSSDLTDQLLKGSGIDKIIDHLIQVRKTAGVTRALALHYPDLDTEMAYKIQMAMLSKLEKQGEKLVGWKMGGARITDPNAPFKPVFGFMLASDEFLTGSTAKSSRFVVGCPLIEAEIGFLMKKDLVGQEITLDILKDAIDRVGGFSEFISIRIRDTSGGISASSAQSIADGVSHGGFIQSNRKTSLTGVDLDQVKAQVIINGKVKSEGDSKNFAFFDAILYLAKALPKYGRHLREGDLILTGSMLVPPPAEMGDTVEVSFSAFDTLRITFR